MTKTQYGGQRETIRMHPEMCYVGEAEVMGHRKPGTGLGGGDELRYLIERKRDRRGISRKLYEFTRAARTTFHKAGSLNHRIVMFL